MNINLILNIFISVLSGILTTGLLFGLGKYFNNVVLPWYRGVIYKGLDIGGKWFESHDYEGMLTQESVINIKQSGEKIDGKIFLAKKITKTKKQFDVKSFIFNGNYSNNFLNITCWNSDQKQIGTHNYLMIIKMDGREMVGIKTYYDIGMQKIRTCNVYWRRLNEKIETQNDMKND